MHDAQAAVFKFKSLVNLEFVDSELWLCCWETFSAGASCCSLENRMGKGNPLLAVSCCLDILLSLSLPLSGRRKDID